MLSKFISNRFCVNNLHHIMFYFQANLAPVDSLLFLWNISCGYEFQDLCSIGLILPIWVIVFDLTWETLTHETHSHYIPLDLRISKATGCCGLQCIWYHLPFPPPSNSRSLSSETFPLIFFFFCQLIYLISPKYCLSHEDSFLSFLLIPCCAVSLNILF